MEKDNKREMILETAKDIILSDGYSKVSINNITNKCNISKGSFYTYFQSKEEMLSVLVNEYEILIKETLKNCTNTASTLEKFLENFVKFRLNFSESELEQELVIINLRKNMEIIDETNFKKITDIEWLSFEEVKKNLEKYKKFTEEEAVRYSEMIFGIRIIFNILDTIDIKEETSLKFKNLKELKKYLQSDEIKKNTEFILESMKKILKN